MLICSVCSTSFPDDKPRWRCDCGAHLLRQSPAMFTREILNSRPSTLWRYREALGICSDDNVVSLGEGFTPIVDAKLEGRQVSLKHDYLCPTGSYKDRGSTVMISKLKEWGVDKLIEDSSGNAGASVAAYAAIAGIQSDIFVPDNASSGKLTQIEAYGARLMRVPGTREDTTQAALRAAESTFYASHNWSPYFLTGLKTVAYEIAEQLGWQAPEWIVTPVGGGNLLAGIYTGFCDLVAHGFVKTLPRMVAVQAANCAPVYQAWSSRAKQVQRAQKKDTAAEGIAVAQPVRGNEVLTAIYQSMGLVITVTEEAIWATLRNLGSQGIYVEPTAAAAPAAIPELVRSGMVHGNDRIVIILTGSGLKATDKIIQQFAQDCAVKQIADVCS